MDVWTSRFRCAPRGRCLVPSVCFRYHWLSIVVCSTSCLTWWAGLGGGDGTGVCGGVIQAVQIEPVSL